MSSVPLPPPTDPPIRVVRLPLECTRDEDERKCPDARPPDLAARAWLGEPKVKTPIANMASIAACKLRKQSSQSSDSGQKNTIVKGAFY
jgi:hypothetical protein